MQQNIQMPRITFGLLTAIALLVGCKKESAPKAPPMVTKIQLEEHAINVPLYRVHSLNVKHYPEELDAPNYIWESGNPDVATVTWKGEVIGQSIGGTTWIYVSGKEDNQLRDSCLVTVVSVPVDAIKIADPPASISVNETKILAVHYTPSDASTKDLEWSSSDPSILQIAPSQYVYNQAKITGVKEGKAIVTAKSIDGEKIASCEVEVTLNGISISPSSVQLLIGEVISIGTTYQDSEIPYPSDVVWNIYDTGIAQINPQEGTGTATLTAIALGKTTLSATPRKDPTKTAECAIWVSEITDFMTTWRTGSTIIVGNYMRGAIVAHIQNTSRVDVQLVKAEVYNSYGTLLGSIEFNQSDILFPDTSKSIDITLEQSEFSPKVIWTLTWQGITYSIEQTLIDKQ